MTVDCAKAFVAACLGSPKVKALYEGVLGYDRLPEMDDFDSNDRDRLDRCEVLLRYVEDCSRTLLATFADRPIQGEIPGTEAEATGRKRRRKAATA